MSSEEERARSFTERHFPEIARFLAAERGEGPAPVFGPGDLQNAHDDQPEPHVVVRVAYRLSRIELFAAFTAGYAMTNVGQDPDSMTVKQIRYDVEGHLADSSVLMLDDLVTDVAGKLQRGEDTAQMEALKRAVDRAYPVGPPAPRPTQNPVYGDGTVTVDTLDHGRITIGEPAWCEGHDGVLVGHRADVTHRGPWIVAEFEGVEFLPACISWAPFSELQPEPMADVDEFPGMGPGELRALAAENGAHCGRLYSKANELDRIRRRQS